MPEALVSALARRGFAAPLPVQAATLPDALAGRDLRVRAPTGSGKTVAFGLPVLVRAGRAAPHRPTALVLSPTRELADQIRGDLAPLAAAVDRRVHAVHGGVDPAGQVAALARGVDVLVACPGRLLDLVAGGHVGLGAVAVAVVDEADRMADMGFLPDVGAILDATPPERQTLLLSATLDDEVAELSARYQRDPARHEVGEVEPDRDAADHHFWRTTDADRVGLAAAVVQAAGPSIVFVRTRQGADKLVRQLSRHGVSAAGLHGGRSQAQRANALEALAAGRVQALVATDVAARGIHVEGIACVVHLDPAADDKAYLHRSGRTARAGARGVVVSLVRRSDNRATRALQRDLGLPQRFVDPDPAVLGDGSRHVAPGRRPPGGR